MSLFRFVVPLIVIACAESAMAQWTQEGAQLAGRFRNWKENSNDPYSPELAIGASSLAFAPDGTLYLACEKHADVLVFPKDGSAPGRIRLTGVPRDGEFPDVDFEGMSIHDEILYIVDEDDVCVYTTPLRDPGVVSKLTVEYDGVKPINSDATDGNTGRRGNLSSVEGIVVSSAYCGPTSQQDSIGPGPYVYLLDELDISGGVSDAKLFVGVIKNGRIRITTPPTSIPLASGFRLPELFESQGQLYAIKSNYVTFNSYEIVRLDVDAARIGDKPCTFTVAATSFKEKGFDSNYEGAAINPTDGRLFLTADNENYPTASNSVTPPRRPDRRGITPIISLQVQR